MQRLGAGRLDVNACACVGVYVSISAEIKDAVLAQLANTHCTREEMLTSATLPCSPNESRSMAATSAIGGIAECAAPLVGGGGGGGAVGGGGGTFQECLSSWYAGGKLEADTIPLLADMPAVSSHCNWLAGRPSFGYADRTTAPTVVCSPLL
jgi:hypothetical protein